MLINNVKQGIEIILHLYWDSHCYLEFLGCTYVIVNVIVRVTLIIENASIRSVWETAFVGKEFLSYLKKSKFVFLCLNN